MKEIWKTIEDYPNYQVSIKGRIRNKKNGLIKKPAIDNSTGYLKVNLSSNKKCKTKAVHRLVAETFLGKKEKMDVNHIDGCKTNNNIKNLEWCTRSENEKHAYKLGLRLPIVSPSKQSVKILETGEVFDSLSACANAIKGQQKTISMCLSDKYNRSAHKGFHFERVNNPEIKKESFLRDYQMEAVKKMCNGCILNGGVGSGKSRTGLYYYFKEHGGSFEDKYIPMKDPPRDLYIITTARKRDTMEWSGELTYYLMSDNPECSLYHNKITIDSWNNIKKYKDVYGAFFIFDEDRVTGSGVWVKSFLNIARKNKWIILSATAGDTWSDYIPVFVANGFYKNKTEFTREHIVYSRFCKFPKVDHYINTGRLVKLRNDILIPMDFQRETIAHHEDVYVKYDISKYKDVSRLRWNPYKNEPIVNAGELCYVWRKVVNSDESRQVAVLEIFEKHPKVIIFYNFDYELDILKNIYYGEGIEVAEWNGHQHQPLPTGDSWVYLVQYTAGAEGWNCITTDTIIFYSQNYSYKIRTQAAGRTDRLNTPFKDLYYYHLKSRSGIDLAISNALKDKKNFNESKYLTSRNKH